MGFVALGCVMKMLRPVLIREVFWKVTWVNAKPTLTTSIGMMKTIIFSHLPFIVTYPLELDLFRMCIEKYWRRYPITSRDETRAIPSLDAPGIIVVRPFALAA